MVSLFGRGFDSLQLHYVPQEGNFSSTKSIFLIIWKCILHFGQLHNTCKSIKDDIFPHTFYWQSSCQWCWCRGYMSTTRMRIRKVSIVSTVCIMSTIRMYHLMMQNWEHVCCVSFWPSNTHPHLRSFSIGLLVKRVMYGSSCMFLLWHLPYNLNPYVDLLPSV